MQFQSQKTILNLFFLKAILNVKKPILYEIEEKCIVNNAITNSLA